MSKINEVILKVHGSFNYLIIYGICLVAILIFGKNLRKQFAIPILVITILVLNPFFFSLWGKLNEAAVYWRALWILPVLPVCAAAIASVADRTDHILINISTTILGTLVFVLCGSFIYHTYLDGFQWVANAEKLPDDVVNVADALLEIDSEPYAVLDPELSVYIRQYDGKIKTAYARSVTYGTPGGAGARLYDLLKRGRYDELSQQMVNYDYTFLVTENETEGKEQALTEAEFQILDQVGRYGIYRAYRKKTEIRTYNDLHQVTSITFLDGEGNAVNRDIGYASVFYDYDDNGRVSYEFHRDSEGNGVPDDTGRAGWRRELDQSGQVISETNLGVDETPVICNYVTRKCEYNLLHRLVKESYYDASDQPMLRTDTFYACKELEYDRLGQLISEHYYGLSHEPVMNNQRFAEIEYIRDEKGNVVEERTYDTNHHLITRNEGYSIIRRTFDEGNRIISETYYDSDLMPINNVSGYHRIDYEYREDGGLSLCWFYDIEGRRVLCGSSYLHEYLQSLARQNLLIFISAKDDASRALTKTLQDDLSTLGITTQLLGKFRYSFYAVITPEGVKEDLNSAETIDCSGQYSDITYSITSGGYLAGNISSIMIDDIEYSHNVRGLNIVVYNLNDHAAESRSFDTCSLEMKVTQ